MQVPTADMLPYLGEDKRLVVALGVLMSYEHMGWVQITCGGGCTCQPKDYDCHTDARQALPLHLSRKQCMPANLFCLRTNPRLEQNAHIEVGVVNRIALSCPVFTSCYHDATKVWLCDVHLKCNFN